MSKIQQELADVTEVTPSKKRDETISSPEYLARLAAAVADLPEADWNKLTPEAQAWYNNVVDANEAKKARIHGFVRGAVVDGNADCCTGAGDDAARVAAAARAASAISSPTLGGNSKKTVGEA